MLRFQRPKPPKGFSTAVAHVRHAVRLAVAAGQTLDHLPSPWREERYKRLFSDAQHDKCGYCETFAFNHPAPMDHYAPKGEVQVLVEDGIETGGLNDVRGRKTLAISVTGYHWLAVAWANWLLGCERCNTGWKRSLFPVREDVLSGFVEALGAAYLLGGVESAKALIDATAPLPPDPGRPFTPLLLNPFGPEDPVEHLEFSEHGQIAPRNGSDRGRATIRTCGLHRESLRRSRQPIAMDTFRLVLRLKHALGAQDSGTAWLAVQDLLALGGEKRIHAGMVRSIVLSQLALRWPQLEIVAKRLKPALATATKRGARGTVEVRATSAKHEKKPPRPKRGSTDGSSQA